MEKFVSWGTCIVNECRPGTKKTQSMENKSRTLSSLHVVYIFKDLN